MPDDFLRADVKLNEQGRIVIPAAFRKALGFKPGDDLVMYIEEEGLRIDTAANIVRRAQEEFAKIPAERDLVAELIERRKLDQQRSDERFERLADEGRKTTRRRRRSA